MPCQHYKNSLIEAAASGAEPQGELRGHLDVCLDCRAAFEQEHALFASIDAGLHVAANADVPGSLLPRVRARLNEATAPRLRWVRLVFASGAVAFAFVIFLATVPHRGTSENVAKESPGVPTPIAPAASKNPEKISSAGIQTTPVRSTRSQMGRNSTVVHSAASSNPEVLVPPDEREAFACFVAVLGERREVAIALVTPVPQAKDRPASLELLQINELEIKLLAGTESEQSNGADQK